MFLNCNANKLITNWSSLNDMSRVYDELKTLGRS